MWCDVLDFLASNKLSLTFLCMLPFCIEKEKEKEKENEKEKEKEKRKRKRKRKRKKEKEKKKAMFFIIKGSGKSAKIGD